MGVRPGDAGSRERGAVPVGAAEGTAPCSPLPITSERFVGITGSSASFPLSNNCRHSSPTEAASGKHYSFITPTRAPLLKTLAGTGSITPPTQIKEGGDVVPTDDHL